MGFKEEPNHERPQWRPALRTRQTRRPPRPVVDGVLRRPRIWSYPSGSVFDNEIHRILFALTTRCLTSTSVRLQLRYEAHRLEDPLGE